MQTKVTGRKVAGEIGEAVRRERAALRLSQQEVARRANVSPNRVVEIEQGEANPRLSTVESVVGAVGLKITVSAA